MLKRDERSEEGGEKMEKRYNSNEEVKDELIEVLMNYLKEVTDTEHPACEAAVCTVPEIAKAITNLLYL